MVECILNVVNIIRIYQNYLKSEICAHALEPYYFMDDDQYQFYNIFNNKKVLIITSHCETTKNQLSKYK